MRIGITVTVLMLGAGLALSACAPKKAPTSVASAAGATSIFEGGLMYDKWWAVLEKDAPGDTHPSYPEAGKKKGKDTWRCKECHGWDFMGKDGAYASGSHFTGIKGIRAMDGGDPNEVESILRSDVHGFTADMIDDVALIKLAHFVTQGQVDFDSFVDRGTKKAKYGDIQNGQLIYDNVCARCHGTDGRAINFKSPPKKEFIGSLANGNPWEFFDKVRHGQPGAQMPALGWLDDHNQIDILAYSQTLPGE